MAICLELVQKEYIDFIKKNCLSNVDFDFSKFDFCYPFRVFCKLYNAKVHTWNKTKFIINQNQKLTINLELILEIAKMDIPQKNYATMGSIFFAIKNYIYCFSYVQNEKYNLKTKKWSKFANLKNWDRIANINGKIYAFQFRPRKFIYYDIEKDTWI